MLGPSALIKHRELKNATARRGSSVAHLSRKIAIKNAEIWVSLGSRGWHVCHVTYSPRLLHFVPTFSKGGERREGEQREGGREKCHHGFHLESSANLRRHYPQKWHIRNRIFLGGRNVDRKRWLISRHGGNAQGGGWGLNATLATFLWNHLLAVCGQRR